MDKIVSYEQIQNMENHIRSLKRGFVTNFYWDNRKHPYWLSDSSLYYDAKLDCFLLIHQSEDFLNIYYIAVSINAFLRHSAEIEFEKDVVLDVITKEENLALISEFLSYGYEMYKHLFRMIHVGPMIVEENEINDSVISANMNDIVAISNALYQCFDPFAEQLPSNMELSDHISNDEIILIMDKDTICGFIIFEIVGVTWYLRYWYTSPDYRNLGIGAKLLKASLIKGKNTKRQILWVMSNNENAIKRYEHYGFKRELLNDYILIKRKHNMKEKIVSILSDLRPEFDFTEEGVNFIEDGMLDSFDMVSLVDELEEQFGIKIDGIDVVADNFTTVANIEALLKKSGAK